MIDHNPMPPSDIPPLRVIRSAKRHRTISIRVEDDAIVVRIPATLPDHVWKTEVRRRQHWIMNMLRQMRTSRTTQPPWTQRSLTLGGDTRHVAFSQAEQWYVRRTGTTLEFGGPVPALDAPAMQRFIRRVISDEASRWMQDRVSDWVAQTGLAPSAVRIADPKSRWGSCSPKGRIMLSWRLALAPVAVADYVVVHELCHLLELNHSPRFWAHVARWIPDHRHHRHWLRQHGHSLFW